MPKRNFKKRSDGFARFKKGDSLAIKALKVAKNIRAVINVEYKKHDVANDTFMTTTAQIINLSLIAQGLTNQQRVGNSILKKYLGMRAVIEGNTASAVTSMQARVILFTWENSNGTAPTAAQILESPTNPLSFYNADLSQETDLRIIKDKIFFVTSNAGNGKFNQALKFNYSFPEGSHIKFKGTGSTETDIKSGGVYVLLLGSEATNSPSIEYYTRLTYIDN